MIIEFRDVSKSFGPHRIFRSLNLAIDRGTFSILTGPSGSGKTTLFKMLCGIDHPTEGQVYFLGRPLVEHSAAHLRQIGLIFQNPRGLLDWTVYDNVELPLLIDGVSQVDREKRVMHWLETLGLRARARSLYRELSGGEIQKAEFARAVIRKPRMILADEPTAHLDAVQAELLLDILWDLHKNGATVFISTHHPPAFAHPSILRYHLSNHSLKLLDADQVKQMSGSFMVGGDNKFSLETLEP